MRRKKISICTGVKNRLQPLLTVLPTWLATDADEILIVDWSSERHIAEHLQSFGDNRLKIIRIQNEPVFHPAIVWNYTIRNAKHAHILKVDGDIFLSGNFFVNLPAPNTFKTGDYKITGKGTMGTILFTKTLFESVNGYNERFRGWGTEDRDLYARLAKRGFMRVYFEKSRIRHLDHADDSRLNNRTTHNLRIAKEEPWTMFDSFYEPAVDYVA